MTNMDAILLYKQQEYEKAIPFFQTIIEDTENDTDTRIEACYYISICYKKSGNPENCLYYLMYSFQFDQPRPEICCELGFYYMEQNEIKKAISWFRFALTIPKLENHRFFLQDCWNYYPNIELCLCYYTLGDLTNACRYNERAGLIKPDSKSYLSNKAFFDSALQVETLQELNAEKEVILKERASLESLPKYGVSLILVTNKKRFIDNIFLNYKRFHYDKKELIIILNKNELDPADYIRKAGTDDTIHVYQLDQDTSLGLCMNFGISKSRYDFVAKIDDDDYYGPNYLLDQMNIFHKQDVEVVVKSRRLIFFESDQTLQIYRGRGENELVLGGGGGTILAKKSIFDTIHFQDLSLAEDDAFFFDCERAGFKVYAGNKFNYVYNRYINPNNHTYIVDDSCFKSACVKIDVADSFEQAASV